MTTFETPSRQDIKRVAADRTGLVPWRRAFERERHRAVRPPAAVEGGGMGLGVAEVLVDGATARLIRRRETYEDLVAAERGL